MNPQPPVSLPRQSLPILIATLIACSGYLLFAARFGDPAREASDAATRMASVERSIPATVDKTVERELDSVKNDIDKAIAVDQRIDLVAGDMTTRLTRLETQIGEFAARTERAEALAAQALQATATASAPATIPGQPRGAATPLMTQPPSQAGTSLAAVAATEPITNSKVDRKAGLRMEILSARVDRGIRLEVSVTKEGGGDGYVALASPPAGARIVTADGVEFRSGSAGRVGSRSMTVGLAKLRLVENVPMRFILKFDGSVNGATLCRRLEIPAFTDADHNNRVTFAFSDITATE